MVVAGIIDPTKGRAGGSVCRIAASVAGLLITNRGDGRPTGRNPKGGSWNASGRRAWVAWAAWITKASSLATGAVYKRGVRLSFL